MSYPTINAAAINGAEGGTGDRVVNLAGVDLVTGGTGAAVVTVTAQGVGVVALGDLGARFLIAPSGIDLVQAGTHTGLFNVLIQFSGEDLVTTGTGAVAVTAYASEAVPLEIGDFRAQNGVDVAVAPEGLDLARQGLHSALASQPAPNVTVEAASARPAELGDLAAVQSGVTVSAVGAYPADWGDLVIGQAVVAMSAHPTEMGDMTTTTGVSAQSARPMELGDSATRFLVAPAGLEPLVVGVHSSALADAVAYAQGALPLEVGELPAPGVGVYARPSFPTQFGPVAVGRGVAC